MKIVKKTIFIIRYISYIPLKLIIFIGNFYSKILKTIDKRNHDTFWQESMQKSIDKNISNEIKISPDKKIKFYCPSKLSSFRAKTLFSKEPETIEWINEYGSENKVLYDVGANVGIYSIYYAKKFGSKVYAFEPSFRNLDLLSRNIKLNLLQDKIIVIPNPLCDSFVISDFFQLQAQAGHAIATFNDKNIKEKLINEHKKFNQENMVNYNTLGLSLDDLIDLKLIDIPNLIKIDVDGNELEVIKGCKNILQRTKNLSILIESQEENKDQVESQLKIFGFKKINQVNSNSIWKK